MTDTEDATKFPSADWIPPDAIEALEISAVNAIRALQSSHGLGLYEAKLVIDAYLQKHPTHPRVLGVSQSASSKTVPPLKTFEQYRDALVATSPIAGEPLAMESLPNRTRPPAHYIVARATNADGGQWFREVRRASLDSVNSSDSVEIVDEEPGSKVGDLLGVTLKLTDSLSRDRFESLTEELERMRSLGVHCRLVRGCGRHSLSIPPEDLQVEYFLSEYPEVAGHVWPILNCVRLTHRPSGIVSRVTYHRRKDINYEEALYLLASLLQDVDDCPVGGASQGERP